MTETPNPSLSQTLGAKQLAIYLTERGVDPKTIPPAAIAEIIHAASDAIELSSLRNSQALVMYMGLLKKYSIAIADYIKGNPDPKASDPVIDEILKTHGVLPAPK